MIIKIYSPPTIHAVLTAQKTQNTEHKNNLSRSIIFTENATHDIKFKAKEISLKYDRLGDDTLCNLLGVKKKQQDRLDNTGPTVTVLEHVAKTNDLSTEGVPVPSSTITEKIK